MPTLFWMRRRRWRKRVLGGTIAVLAVAAATAVASLPFVVDHPADPVAQLAPGEPEVRAPDDPGPDPRAPRVRLLAPEHGVYMGVSNFELVTEPGAIGAWSSAHGARPRIVNWFQQWLSGEQRFRADWARRVQRAGAVPMITWEPWYAPAGEIHVPEQPDIALARIAGGDYDPYIRSWARAVALHRGPVLIRLMHEMNGNWYPWGVEVNGNSPEAFVAAWRHVHGIFDAAGAENVDWVWSINNLEGPAGRAHDLAPYYPGDRYVDWVSTSGFNWGDAYEWSSWREADALYSQTYDKLSRLGKPIMISEIGTTAIGGDSRTWVVETLRRLRTGYPKLRAILWYDDIDAAGLDFRLLGPTARAISEPRGIGTDWLQKPRFRALPD